MATPSSAVRTREAPLALQTRISVSELTHMLGALGEAKARDVIVKTIKLLNFPAHELERWQALQVLETIAAEPGLVGITARFAKARAVMRWPAPR